MDRKGNLTQEEAEALELTTAILKASVALHENHQLSISGMFERYFFHSIIKGVSGMYQFHRPLTPEERAMILRQAVVIEKDCCTTIEIK